MDFPRMHVGMAVVFQNPFDQLSDRQVYQNELRLGDQAEPLGFESIWGVEHHFTDYTMCPDVLQYLTYFAGRTKKVLLGSMVVVLPWHNPMRVAEQVAVLDHMCDGRLVLGLGRGLGRVEFDGMGVSMDESRDRFVESAQMLVSGLEKGFCEFDGQHIRQAPRDIRPRPFKSFRGRTYAAAVSPESVPIVAGLGLGILVIPQKPWDIVAQDLETYDRVYREVNDGEPPRPICAGWVFCDEDAGRAEELARKYIGDYWRSVLRHYELVGDHLADKRGYESYARMQQIASSEGGEEKMVDFFLGLQCWGTPEQCYERVVDVHKRVGNNAFNAVFSYSGMPFEEADRNMKLFARTVMPELQKLEI